MNNTIKEQILIVDDAVSITDIIKALLEDSGYAALTCQNAADAVRVAIETRPDLILLDIMMPGIDGYTICAQLKADSKTKDIPVIFLSALNSSFDKVKAFKCGAVDFVPKPVQNDELLARVKTHLTISQLHRSLMDTNRDLEAKIKERTQSLETENENLRHLNSLLEHTLVKYRDEKEKAEAAVNLRKDILEEIRHEFKTPLQSILGFASLLTDSNVPEQKVKEYASIIVKCSDFIGTSFDKIINYSLCASGGVKPKPENVNVSELLADVCTECSDFSRNKNITLLLNDLLESDNILFTDRKMLRSILQNLVSNAIEFTKEGSVDINASFNNGNFIFCVTDTGIGIHPEKIDIIFNPFAQKDGTNAKGYVFTTIGLGLVKSYVDILGGEIWFDSTPGRGTEFYVSLPADALRKPQKQEKIFENKNVIVADDDDMSYILLYEALKPTGITIKRAKDGKELFEMFRKNHPDMVITNLKLPVMNGTEALKMIKSISPKTVGIAQMPYFSAVDKRDYSNSLCDDYIERPAKQEQIIEVLKKHLINNA